jgi:hypothetical protein
MCTNHTPCLALFAFGVFLVRATAAQDSDDLFIYQCSSGADQWSYFIKWDQVPCKVRWNAEREPFPVALGTQANRAWAVLASERHITNQMDVVAVEIFRLHLSEPQLQDRGIRPGDLTNQWFLRLSFRFGIPPHEHECGVVSLLDGSYAREQRGLALDVNSAPRAKAVAEQGVEVSPSPAQIRPADPEAHVPPNPLLAITKPGSRVCKVQWRPLLEAFPMDLNAEAQRARAFLSDQELARGEPIWLDSIRMDRVCPVEAILAQGLDLFANRFHWVITFQYRSPRSGPDRFYAVIMLLDGRILGATEY